MGWVGLEPTTNALKGRYYHFVNFLGRVTYNYVLFCCSICCSPHSRIRQEGRPITCAASGNRFLGCVPVFIKLLLCLKESVAAMTIVSLASSAITAEWGAWKTACGDTSNK